MSKLLRTCVTLVLILGSFVLLYRAVLVKLVSDWYTDDNYSHGFLIVPIALFFVWERRHRLLNAAVRPSWVGLAVIIASVAVLIAGLLGAELFLTRISILGFVTGTILFLFGWAHLAILVFPLLFLLLMIPIPAIIFNQIAFPLQILASRFGEAALTVLGIPVLREGNVITLATTSLEVAEACSGIRSLISLLTLAIVYGYLADPRIWARVVLALASIPVAIVANGVRVAGTGVAAHSYGADAAMGFFHTFSGWLVFLVALILLFVVQRVIVLVAPIRPGIGNQESGVRDRKTRTGERATGSRTPTALNPESRILNPGLIRPFVIALCLVLGAVVIGRTSKSELTPARESFSTFPMEIGDWRGESVPRFNQQILAVLGVDEYVTRTYYAPSGRAVGLYVGFYQSQRQGDTMHSPLNCLPGAGWEPVKKERVTIEVPTTTGTRAIVVNRIVILKGLDKQVVLYWYQSHGRVVASEYWGKIYTVVDAIRLNRTDAAMVRVISPVTGSDAAAEQTAERLTVDFTRAMFPLLGRYLPD